MAKEDLDSLLDDLEKDLKKEKTTESKTEKEKTKDTKKKKEDKKGKKKEETKDKKKPIPDVCPREMLLLPVNVIKEVDDTNTRGKVQGPAFDRLCESVADEGVYEPVGVVDNGDKTYTLHRGKRRLTAAKKVGAKLVPAVLIDPEVQDKNLASVIENIMREPLNPVEEARSYDLLMKEHKMNQARLSKAVGKSAPYINMKLLLLKAGKALLEDLIAGKVTEEAVRKAVRKESTRKRKKGAAVAIPDDALPSGVSVSVGAMTVTVTMKLGVEAGDVTNLGKAVKAEAEKVLKSLSAGKLNSGYKEASN